MLSKKQTEKLLKKLIKDNLRLQYEVQSFSIHTNKPISKKILNTIAEKTNTTWVNFFNYPDYLFTQNKKL